MDSHSAGDWNPVAIPAAAMTTPLLAEPAPRRRRSSTIAICVSVAGILAVALLFVAALDYDTSTSPPPTTARGVAEGVSAKSAGHYMLRQLSFSWNNQMLGWQRSAYHFQPQKNWMNDPNGPLFYKGWYHLFYQYNPKGAIWGNIVWGHAVSRDLIHWRHLPIAMTADHWYDINGVWTGSATFLRDGQLVMLYTGSTNESVQVQNLAYPSDPSDPLLLEWVKYEGNPVLVPPPGIGNKDFRDPTTAWATSEGKWRIAIGSKVNKTGITLLYDTEDFRSYELLDGALHGVPGTGMWECVDFYPVSKVSKNGLDTSDNGPGVKHVLKSSLDDDRNDYYALGSYDEASGKWTPDNPAIDVGIGLRYDYGTFYASKTFYDQETKRRILWGWITETDSESSDVQKGWASLQSIPRTVALDEKTGSNLKLWPVQEVEKLRTKKAEFANVVVNPGTILPLNVSSANKVDIVAEFDVEREALERAEANGESYSCSGGDGGGAANRGAVGPFGLLVLTDSELTERTPVYFYITKDVTGNLTAFFCADHLKSSQASDVVKGIHGSQVTWLNGEKLTMRILVDHSIVESFAQGGRTCITSRIYPTKAIYENAKLFLFNNATKSSVTASVKVWQMNSAEVESAESSSM
ncbi:unnamed protein product [Cuscuta campestris]|uniref:Beta-fructofuranosidase n=1 Tax=Cuscuta campestris TaxID=132261 RepID=A0A484MIS6_9ASTE|nr:unnamed protein product [Cuscuta campestris]